LLPVSGLLAVPRLLAVSGLLLAVWGGLAMRRLSVSRLRALWWLRAL
jgi:hypothetical protein